MSWLGCHGTHPKHPKTQHRTTHIQGAEVANYRSPTLLGQPLPSVDPLYLFEIVPSWRRGSSRNGALHTSPWDRDQWLLCQGLVKSLWVLQIPEEGTHGPEEVQVKRRRLRELGDPWEGNLVGAAGFSLWGKGEKGPAYRLWYQAAQARCEWQATWVRSSLIACNKR